MSSVTVDLITFDSQGQEYVLYLVESEPIPTSGAERKERLGHIQNRVFDAFDVVVDGVLESKFPDSRGKAVRIEVDTPTFSDDELEELIRRVDVFTRESEQYRSAVEASTHTAVRIVTGRAIGRFG